MVHFFNTSSEWCPSRSSIPEKHHQKLLVVVSWVFAAHGLSMWRRWFLNLLAFCLLARVVTSFELSRPPYFVTFKKQKMPRGSHLWKWTTNRPRRVQTTSSFKRKWQILVLRPLAAQLLWEKTSKRTCGLINNLMLYFLRTASVLRCEAGSLWGEVKDTSFWHLPQSSIAPPKYKHFVLPKKGLDCVNGLKRIPDKTCVHAEQQFINWTLGIVVFQ